jgi:hypothetical protein
MQHFVETENIAHFKALLETETNPDKRRVLQKLLADEEAKLHACIDVERRKA